VEPELPTVTVEGGGPDGVLDDGEPALFEIVLKSQADGILVESGDNGGQHTRDITLSIGLGAEALSVRLT
jgi:hypothetical protein